MTIYLVRHAHAGSRRDWDGPDDRRPLSKRGRSEAAGVASALADAGIGRLYSSPSVRCAQTIEPLAAKVGVEVEHHPALAEGAPVELGLALLDEHLGDTIACCSHGDVIPELMAALEARGLDIAGKLGTQKGGWWELRTKHQRFTKAVYHPPNPH